jgi:uncharacterized protein
MTAGTRVSAPTPIAVAKILIVGGYGVGKTTFTGSISEIVPVTTEVMQTDRGHFGEGDPTVAGKTTTTVAMDFGRITLDDDLVLYLFGTPGQTRFWFMWDTLAAGALGAVVLVDVRRFTNCFPAIDYLEQRQMPMVIAVNQFPDSRIHTAEQLRSALCLGPLVPIHLCDARDRESVKTVLISLTQHAIAINKINSRAAVRA